MICMAAHCWWPYLYRELIVKATECKPCTVIGKNLKSIIPAKQFNPHIPCAEPNQKIQIDFEGPIFDERGNEVYFLAAIDRFSNYLTAYIYDKANGPNVLMFLDMYIENHRIPRSIRLDQAKCLVGNQVKTFCNEDNIDIIEAPVNDHRAIGLVERLIQIIKNRLAYIKEEKLPTHAFHVKHALKIIIHQLRICKQRTTKTSPFEAHFGRKPNTPLSVIATKPNLSNLTYKNIITHYLDEDTVMPEEILPDDKWVNGYRSDIEVEIGMSRATGEAKDRERELVQTGNPGFWERRQFDQTPWRNALWSLISHGKYMARNGPKRTSKDCTRYSCRARTSWKSAQQLLQLRNPASQSWQCAIAILRSSEPSWSDKLL